MKESHKKISNTVFNLLVGSLSILVVGAGVLGYYYREDLKRLQATKLELENTKTDLGQLLEYSEKLSQNLADEQSKNAIFEGQISQIVGTVGNLDKLAKTDKELLQKYSKVYFLNEHYIPDGLALLPKEFVYNSEERTVEIHSKVLPYLTNLLNEAKGAGIELLVISGYRSFGEQGTLKNGYTVVYGSGANKFSADQGYSEHQLGTTLDFTTPEIGANFEKFKTTEAYKWLQENAHRFGFILSYPEGNSYYQFEPWHWRFVGKSLAGMLFEEKESFYNLGQNRIDAYLINIFD